MLNQDMLTGGLIAAIIMVIGYYAYGYYEKHYGMRPYNKGGFHGHGGCPCGCGQDCHCPPNCNCRLHKYCPPA